MYFGKENSLPAEKPSYPQEAPWFQHKRGDAVNGWLK
jgi:hypothetical protein